MTDSSALTLFQLLRLALGNKAECSLPADINWQNLISLSFDQGVAAIAVDGLQKLYESNSGLELAIDKEDLENLKYEWFGEVLRSEDDYRKYVEDIISLVKVYADAGIEMMILKGYGLSLNYPVPAHRPTGDIDVYLFGKWREADKLLSEKGIAIDYSHHHHSVFSWNGQTVENHYDIDDRYTSLNGRLVDDLLKEIVFTNRKQIDIQSVGFFLPSATFNGIFLITHAAEHFAGDHITLRHLLDWALFVDKQWKEIDWSFVMDWLSRFGHLRFFTCISALCIDILGIQAEKFPPLDRDVELEKRVLEDILHPAFSEKGDGVLFKLRRLKANMWKRNLVALEPLVPRMARLAWSHVIRPEKRIRI